MSNERASYLSDPTIQYLPRLLQEIREGFLAFPKFQRPAVWKQEQREELFRSVLRGLPIGTFMTWRSKVTVPTFERIGSIPLGSQRDAGSGRQYVLDGLQRLSTLYSEFLGPNEEASRTESETSGIEDEENTYFPIAVDLRVDLSELKLLSLDEDTSAEDLSYALRLSDAMDSRRFLKRLRGLEQLEERDMLVERAEAVATRLREYKIPVVPFVSDDLQEVTRAFQLINSQGTPMSIVHMVNALSWREGFRLLDELEGCREDLAVLGWAGVDEKILLRCFAVTVGLDAYEFDVTEFAEKLVAKQDARRHVVAGLGKVAASLRESCGIYAPELVPYSVQVLVLFSALRDIDDLSEEMQQRAGNWLWYTTYLEAFSGSISASMIKRVVEELKDALKGEPLAWSHRGKRERRPFPRSFDFRHARSRAMALLLARMQSEEQGDGASKVFFELLAHQGANAMPNLVPTTRSGPWRRRLGGRFLVDPKDVLVLKNEFDRGLEAAEELRGHGVSGEALEAFVEQDYKAFVEMRSKELEEREAMHFEEVKKELGVV
ncbi:MAG: DUF262 domain-containing protein [Deltaproteobacteria bacterium]|nr:DUF262 domain-containing protein [Deltaproteobacteria bacterium]